MIGACKVIGTGVGGGGKRYTHQVVGSHQPDIRAASVLEHTLLLARIGVDDFFRRDTHLEHLNQTVLSVQGSLRIHIDAFPSVSRVCKSNCPDFPRKIEHSTCFK
jgi:hypothetical protein